MVRYVGFVVLLSALIGTKDQDLVLDQWAGGGKTILVLLQNATRRVQTLGKPVIGVEIFVPEKLEHGCVEVVGATFGNDIDVGAGIAPRGGIKHRRLHFEFLDGVGTGSRNSRRVDP